MTDDLFSLRVSADAACGKDRIEEFREHFAKAILRVEMEPLRADEFKFDMMLHALPGFGMATGSVSAVRNHRRGHMIDNDDLVIVFLDNGDASLACGGRVNGIRAGDAVVTENDQTATFSGHTETQITNLRFKRERLLPLLNTGFAGAAHMPLLKGSPALELLKQYAFAVKPAAPLASAQTRRVVVEHLYDLAALAIGANRDGEEAAKQHGLRAARLRAIKTAILRNLGNRDLNVAALAERQGITQRYVQMLFEAEGTTFSEFLLVQRLKRAHRLLSDPAFKNYSISAIAFEVGFNDLSYFNRTFRRRFGMTPTDARQAAKSPD